MLACKWFSSNDIGGVAYVVNDVTAVNKTYNYNLL